MIHYSYGNICTILLLLQKVNRYTNRKRIRGGILVRNLVNTFSSAWRHDMLNIKYVARCAVAAFKIHIYMYTYLGTDDDDVAAVHGRTFFFFFYPPD